MTTYRTLYIDETNDGIFVGPAWEGNLLEAIEKEQIVFKEIPSIVQIDIVEIAKTITKPEEVI